MYATIDIFKFIKLYTVKKYLKMIASIGAQLLKIKILIDVTLLVDSNLGPKIFSYNQVFHKTWNYKVIFVWKMKGVVLVYVESIWEFKVSL